MPAIGAAAELVRAVRDGLPAEFEWTPRDRALLDLAERQAADLDLIEEDIASRGARLPNERLNTALCEARQGRVALGRLLGLVDLPDEAATSSLHARKAARARWQDAG
jgi:hypothetical protein